MSDQILGSIESIKKVSYRINKYKILEPIELTQGEDIILFKPRKILGPEIICGGYMGIFNFGEDYNMLVDVGRSTNHTRISGKLIQSSSDSPIDTFLIDNYFMSIGQFKVM